MREMLFVTAPDFQERRIDDTLPLPPDQEPDTSRDIPRPRPRRRRLLRDVIETLLIFIVVYTLVNLITARFIVDGSSMAPNFATGQYVMVNRASYLLNSPQRGDVIVFISPENEERDLIKRVIGLPGEQVVVESGLVYINGEPLDEPYTNAQPRYHGEWALGPDEYFVLGDNRNNSRDSHNFGLLRRKNIIGQAVLIYWPPQDWRIIPHHDYAVSSAPPATLIPTATVVPVP